MAAVLHGGPIGQLTAAFEGFGLDNRSETLNADSTLRNSPTASLVLFAASSQNQIEEVKKLSEITPSRLDCFKQLRDELTCAVCLDICVRPCTTPCGHNYCRSCLRRNIELNRPCPKCRANLPPGYALNINTTLWNTIQHLFPAEASSKPLTPPPAQPKQQTAGTVGQQLRNVATAPFQPPRFISGYGDAGRTTTNSYSSSRSNASTAVAHTVHVGTIGVASMYGRSVSGPRPHRLPSSGSSSRLGPVEARAQPSRCGHVFSLAELGVRPAREGAAARRDRRRSRSADRWEASLFSRPAAGGLISTTELSSDSSRLLHLLPSATARNGASIITSAPPQQAQVQQSTQLHVGVPGVAGVSGPSVHQPHSSVQQLGAGGHGLHNNPFLRLPRPAAAPAPSRAAAGAISGGVGAMVNVRTAGASQTRAEDQGSAVGGAMVHFTASQRALLNAYSSTQLIPPDTRGMLSCHDSTVRTFTRSQEGSESATTGTTLRAASTTSLGGSSCTGGGNSSRVTFGSVGSSWSVPALDDASELELLPGTGFTPGPCGLNSSMPSGNVTPQEDNELPGPRQNAAYQGITVLPSTYPFSQPSLHVDNDSDVGLDRLEECTLEIRGNGISHAMTMPCSPNTFEPAVQGVAGSPTWSELDDQMARALQPLSVSPTSLPRLRMEPRRIVAFSELGLEELPSPTRSANMTRNLGPGRELHHTGNRVAHGMDPDLASNYDGEDPSGADTFFSSPFFDHSMLAESLQEAGADINASGSEAGFSPRWLANARGANFLQDGSGDLLRNDAALLQDADTTDSSEARQQAPMRGSVPRMPVDNLGTRECPIELLSDIEECEGPGVRVDSDAAELNTSMEPMRRSTRVVSGLRRPRRK